MFLLQNSLGWLLPTATNNLVKFCELWSSVLTFHQHEIISLLTRILILKYRSDLSAEKATEKHC